MEEGHRGGRLRSSRECDAEEHVSRDKDQANGEVQEGKRIQGTSGENMKNYGQQIMSVKTPEDSCARARGSRRREKTSGVGITHHPVRERLVHWEG